MTLRASKNKKSPTLGLLAATLHKNTGGIILLCVAMLIFCPGLYLAAFGKTEFKPEFYTSPDMLSTLYGITVAFSCILVCAANYVNFAYLYKKSSSDVFGALPLTRTGMLFSRAAAGFIGILIPVTIGYVSLAFLSIPYPAYAIGTLSQIASAYLVNVLLMLAFSGFSLIFIICAGSGFDLILSFCGFNAAVFAVGGIMHTLCDTYLSGYSNEYTGIIRIMSPIFYLAEKAVLFADGNYALKGSADILLGILKYAVAFFITAPLLYNFRKAERGEQAYAYKFIYVVCGVLAGICGGYALSQIFIFAADTREYSTIGFVSFVAGAIITTVVYGAVTDRGFKGFKRSMAVGGASAVVYTVIAIIIMTGAFGFESRVPEKEDVTAVSVGIKNITVDLNNPDDAIALHKAIIDRDADDDEDDEVDSTHDYILINYQLDGGEMMRKYFVDTAAVKGELFKIYSSEERFAEIDKFMKKAEGGRLDIYGDYNVGGDDSLSVTGAHLNIDLAKEIVASYRRELTALGDKYFTEARQTGTVADISFEAEVNDNYDSLEIITTADFPETNKLISALTEKEN